MKKTIHSKSTRPVLSNRKYPNNCNLFLLCSRIHCRAIPIRCRLFNGNKIYDSSYNPAFANDSNSIYVPSFSSDSIDVTIPKHLSDSILKALIAVYNATEITERDTVIDLFEIHTHREFDLNRFSVPSFFFAKRASLRK